MLLLAIAVGALLGVGVAVVASQSDGDGDAQAGATQREQSVLSGPKKAANAEPTVVDPARHLGPQGRVGQFVVHCAFSHSEESDPIVHFGMAGMSHMHNFYGADETNESSTPEELVEGGTTCDKKGDTAAYWQPELYDRNVAVEPNEIAAYYRAAPGVDPKTVESFPFGISMLAGDQFADGPQPGEATGWTCGSRTDLSDVPPECAPSAPLHLVLTFADCWDGTYLDSVDHVSHVAYSLQGECPDGYPVHLPQLTMSIRYPISGPDHDLSLASGDIYTAHGDFLNAWDPEALEREVDACIRRDTVCDLASNREEEALFSYEG